MWHSALWQRAQSHLAQLTAGMAVQDGSAAISGVALLGAVNVIAELLRPHLNAHAAAPDPPILGLFLTNSASYVAAVLAALKLGAAFLPLDPRWPAHRLQQVLREAQPAVVLWAAADRPGRHGRPGIEGVTTALVQLPSTLWEGSPSAAGKPSGRPGSPPPGPEGLVEIQSGPSRIHAATWQQVAAPGSGGAAQGAACAAGPSRQLPYCYVMYTSGSTGAPLGVCGTEQGILNRCSWMQQAYPFLPGDCVAFKTSPCFVDSLWEIFGPLLAGAPLLAIPQASLTSPRQLLELCVSHRVSHLAAVPTLWRALLDCLERDPGLMSGLALRVAVSSGEPLPAPLLVRMQMALPRGATILNLYGSTEVAADCTAFDCTSWQPHPPEPAAAAAGAAGAAGQLRPGGSRGAPQRAGPQPGGRAEGGDVGSAAATAAPSALAAAWDVAGMVPVGAPIGGLWVGIVDRAQREEEEKEGRGQAAAEGGPLCFLPPGGPSPRVGEVVVAGAGLAVGYLHQPAVTARRFLRVPRAALPARFLPGDLTACTQARDTAAQHVPATAACGAVAASGAAAAESGGGGGEAVRMFLTGDLGCRDAGGRLWLCGRADLQVKLAGVRFDLAEVEAALCQHPAVHAAAARVWELQAGPALAAYVELVSASSTSAPTLTGPPAATTGGAPNEEDLQVWCQRRLPPAAVPTAVVLLPHLPRSAAGKVQRAALPPPRGWQLERRAQHDGGSYRQLPPAAPAPNGSPAAARAAAAAEPRGEGEAGRPAKRLHEDHPPAQPPSNENNQPSKRGQPYPAAPGEPRAATPQPPPGPGPPPSEAQVARAFAGALRGLLRAPGAGQASAPPALEPTTSIFELGADSLAVAGIAEALGVPAEVVYEHPTVRGLASHLAVQRAQRAQHASQQPVVQRGGPSQGGGAAALPPQQGLGGLLGLARLLGGPQAVAPGALESASQGGDAGVGPLWGPRLQLAWRARMLQCVDAPLLATSSYSYSYSAAAPGSLPASGQAQPRVFACSHGGDVCCFDGGSGERLWEAALPDRADVGMALCCPLALAPQPCAGAAGAAAAMAAAAAGERIGVAVVGDRSCHGGGPCVAVGTNGGTVVFLDADLGHVLGSVDTGGGLRAAPAADPWRGMAWVATHSSELVALAPPGEVLARQPCSAAVSAQVAFLRELRMAFVACLDGTLLALRVMYLGLAATPPGGGETARGSCMPPGAAGVGGEAAGTPTVGTGVSPADPGAAAAATAADAWHSRDRPPPVASHLSLQVVWRHKGSAPLFAPPLVLPGSQSCQPGVGAGAGLVLAAAVDGSISALEAASGRLVWQCRVGGPVFAPLVLLDMPSMPSAGARAAGSSEGLRAGSHGEGGAPARRDAPGPAAPATQAAVVLVGSQAGDLCALDARTGTMLAQVQLGAKVTGLCMLGAAASVPPVPSPPCPVANASTQPASATLQPALSCPHWQGQEDWLLVCMQPGLVCLLDARAFIERPPKAAQGGPGSGGMGQEPAALQQVQQAGAAGAAGLAAGAPRSTGGQAASACTAAERSCPKSFLGPVLEGCLLDVVRLPGEVFSVPVAAPWGGAVVGCRDDHLYCLRVQGGEALSLQACMQRS